MFVWCSAKTVRDRAQSFLGRGVSVVRVGAFRVVHVAGEHVVVHVDGAAVVDGVAQPLSHDGLAGVGRQTQLEETCLGSGKAVIRLRREQTDKECCWCLPQSCQHTHTHTHILEKQILGLGFTLHLTIQCDFHSVNYERLFNPTCPKLCVCSLDT